MHEPDDKEAGGIEGGLGHPLPDSAEARTDLVPEHLVAEKGHGEDAHAPSEPSGEAVAPDGRTYPIETDDT